jgi:hypothetical protein
MTEFTIMKKRLLLCLGLLLGIQLAHAQYFKTDTATRRGFDPSRLMIGGSLGLIFGDYTNVNISPMIGYRFSNMVAAGININAQYGSQRWRDFATDRTTQRDQYTVFGGGLWGRFYPLEMLFIHAQPEYNFVSLKSTFYTDPKETIKDNYGVPSLLLGGGYSQPVGGNSAFYIMILYDVLQDDRSPYQNRPLFRAGMNVGF